MVGDTSQYGHDKRLTMELYQPIAKRLNEERIRQGMKKNYFCMMFECKRRTIDRWFSGERVPNVIALWMIARRLGIPLDDLLSTKDTERIYEHFIHNEELIDEVGLR